MNKVDMFNEIKRIILNKPTAHGSSFAGNFYMKKLRDMESNDYFLELIEVVEKLHKTTTIVVKKGNGGFHGKYGYMGEVVATIGSFKDVNCYNVLNISENISYWHVNANHSSSYVL